MHGLLLCASTYGVESEMSLDIGNRDHTFTLNVHDLGWLTPVIIGKFCTVALTLTRSQSQFTQPSNLNHP